ncbi:EPM2A-interacting protein 1-like [Osmia bicornis bicornis]|uniref:EPM2A-interacting protein 1-like n=1 Tax=Osmia bicornis bicornis TaxID=1437191 RepID=UPI001EAF6726|nr:EPM2A-interacting protein 1-like [Osmia bicornis bicornis]
MAGPSVLKRSTSGGQFNPQWEQEFLFMEHNNTALCLICHKQLNSNKRFNIQRHFNNNHEEEIRPLSAEERAAEVSSTLEEQAEKNACNNQVAVRASFMIALEIAKSTCSFQDGEMIRRCVLAVVEQVCPEKTELCKSISLSRRTLTRRVEMMAEDSCKQLRHRCRNFNELPHT